MSYSENPFHFFFKIINIEGLTTMEAAEKALEAIKRLLRDIGIPQG